MASSRCGGRVVLLDWQFATTAPPAVDLSWFLATFTTVLPCSLDEAIEQYRAGLVQRLGDRFDVRWWEPQLELARSDSFCALVKMFRPAAIELYPLFHDHYRALLPWWYERMRAAVALL